MKFILSVVWGVFLIPYSLSAFSNTALLYHWADSFQDIAGSESLSDGTMQTITIEHASDWKYGKNFFFADATMGNFNSGKQYRDYLEWAPKLSFSKISKQTIGFSFIRDISLAAELNQGDAFQAGNLGLALHWDIPSFVFFETNIFLRKDNYNETTYQITLAWKSTFTLWSVPCSFEGFFDHYGVDYGSQTLTQPRLLIDASILGISNFQFGTELYYFRSSASAFSASVETFVPQIALKWIW